MGNMVELIGSFEDFIELSKLYHICEQYWSIFVNWLFEIGGQSNPALKITYADLNRKIELFTKWACKYIIEMMIVSFAIASIGASYANYYIFDLKDDSFVLPIPIMCVLP